MFLEICLTLLLIVCFRLFIYKTKAEKLIEKIPGPKKYPIIGHLLEFDVSKEEISETVKRLSFEYGPVLHIQTGTDTQVCLRDPADLEKILTSTKDLDKGHAYYIIEPFLNEGLLTCDGNRWRTQRKFLMPAFHYKILEGFISVFVKNTKILLETFSKNIGVDFDVSRSAQLCALDIIAETSMGLILNAQTKDCEYVKVLDELLHIIAKRNYSVLERTRFFKLMPNGRKHDKLVAYLHNITENIIKEQREKMKNANNKKTQNQNDDGTGLKEKKAFLDLILQYSADGSGMTDVEIRQEVDTFMFAGHDTTSSAISFTLYCISQNQDVQEKLYEEISSVLGDDDRDPTYQDLIQLKYLENVIKESMRLYTVVPIISRQSSQEIQLKSGYILPKNTTIMLLLAALNVDPEVFPDPNKFDPDRFLDKPSSPYSYLPFSAGPRNCIGQKFAILELKTVIAMVIRRFYLHPSDIPIKLLFHIVIKSKTGCNLKLEPRL